MRLFVGERLSYPDERTEAYDPDATYDPLCMAYIENDAPESGLPPVGLSDEAFIRGKTPMTKRDVRALVVSALHLKPNGVVWDIGAGTGSVSVECARQCPLGEVYAVEMKDEALDLIRRNAERFHALNLRVVPGRALEVLSALPRRTRFSSAGRPARQKLSWSFCADFNARFGWSQPPSRWKARRRFCA